MKHRVAKVNSVLHFESTSYASLIAFPAGRDNIKATVGRALVICIMKAAPWYVVGG